MNRLSRVNSEKHLKTIIKLNMNNINAFLLNYFVKYCLVVKIFDEMSDFGVHQIQILNLSKEGRKEWGLTSLSTA